MILERTIPFSPLAKKHSEYIRGGLDSRISVAEGAIRCIDGDTLIYDPVKNEHIKARDYQGGHVYAFDGEKLVVAKASKAYRFKKVKLFEVILKSGKKIVVSEGHRLLTPDGWQPISEHIHGDSFSKVLSCEFYQHPLELPQSLQASTLGNVQKVQHEDVQNSLKKAPSSQGNCSVYPRQYDEQLLMASNNVQELVPSQAGVRERNHLYLQKGDQGHALNDNHLYQSYNPVSINESLPHKNEGALYRSSDKAKECHSGGKFYECLSQYDSKLPQSQSLSYLRRQAPESYLDHLLSNDSFPCEVSPLRGNKIVYPNYTLLYDEIVSITYKKYDYYYDLHVPGFENFLANGIINHNSGKTIDHCIIAAARLEICRDKIHLASGSTLANAKLNIGVCNGFGLEALFRGRCRWGKFRDNEALYIQTQTGEKIVIFAGGGKADSYKRILGNSYGIWIATEINEHYDSPDSRTSFIKVAMGRQAAALDPLILWDLNPCNPNHSIYADYIDLYREQKLPGYQYQHFTLEDNLSITEERRNEIKAQYNPESVWYRRDILGQRVIAEGLIFRQFADNSDKWIVKKVPDDLQFITYGVDFGENHSHTVFVATGIRRGGRGVVALMENRLKSKGVDPSRIESEFVDFVIKAMQRYPGPRHTYAFCDHPETIVNGIAKALYQKKLPIQAVMAQKEEIRTRIYAQEKLLNREQMQIMEECRGLIYSLNNQAWDPAKHEDTRLDNDPDVADVADAWEYSWEAFIDEIGVR